MSNPIWKQPDFDPCTFLYQYKAIHQRFIDGDTLMAHVDKGMGDWRLGRWDGKQFTGVPVRFARINAPPKNSEDGMNAKRFAETFLSAGAELRLFTYRDKDCRYGRLLADIRLMDGRCLNDLIVSAGHAVYRKY